MREYYTKKLIEILSRDNSIWIYGTGKVAYRLWTVIESIHMQDVISGFVTTVKEDKKYIDNKEIVSIDELINEQHDLLILVAVGDVNQEGIIYELLKRGQKNYVDCYPYSFLCEANFSEEIFNELPTEIEIRKDELLVNQFVCDDFDRYDVLIEIEKRKRKNHQSNDIYEVGFGMKLNLQAEDFMDLVLSKEKKVKIHFSYIEKKFGFNKNWLVKNNYDLTIYEALLEKYKNNNLNYFRGIIWPTVETLFDEIENELKLAACGFESKDIELSKNEFCVFIRKIYQIDDVDEWKIDEKTKSIICENKDTYTVRFFDIKLENPQFEIKRFGHTISKHAVELKNNIRDKYKTMMDNYYYDNIVHLTDNYDQSERMWSVIKEYLN